MLVYKQDPLIYMKQKEMQYSTNMRKIQTKLKFNVQLEASKLIKAKAH